VARRAVGTHSHDRSPGPIPSTVSGHLCIDFVNSHFTEHTGGGQTYDRLELVEWRRWFVDRCGLSFEPALGSVTRRRLVEERRLLRRLLEAGTQPDRHTAAELNRLLSCAGQFWELAQGSRGFRLHQRWSDEGWPAVMAAVAASYARLLVSGGIRRVRVCANPDCSFMFYDDTRNASRRWCDVAICGNLVKVRHLRARTHS